MAGSGALEAIVDRIGESSASGAFEVNAVKAGCVYFAQYMKQAASRPCKAPAGVQPKYIFARRQAGTCDENPRISITALDDV